MSTPLAPYTLEQAEEDIAVLRGQVDALTETLQLVGGLPTAPNTPQVGNVILFASGGQPNYVNSSGLVMGLQGAQNAFFPGITAASASNTVIAAFTVPANDPEVGAVYELEVWGNGVNGSTSQTLTFGTSYGGTVMSGTFTLGALAWSASQIFRFRIAIRVICIGPIGASCAWSSLIFGEISSNANLVPSSSGQMTGGMMQCESTGTSTISTLAQANLSLYAAWGATTGSPTLTSRVALPKRIA